MKTIKQQLKPTAFLLTFLILFQACAVYHNQSVSLEEAAKSAEPVKVETKYKDFKYIRIDDKDGIYYGVKYIGENEEFIPLNNIQIQAINLKDDKKSKVKTIGLIIGVVASAALMVYFASGDWFKLDLNSDN